MGSPFVIDGNIPGAAAGDVVYSLIYVMKSGVLAQLDNCVTILRFYRWLTTISASFAPYTMINVGDEKPGCQISHTILHC